VLANRKCPAGDAQKPSHSARISQGRSRVNGGAKPPL
jgi:hypothetical protein